MDISHILVLKKTILVTGWDRYDRLHAKLQEGKRREFYNSLKKWERLRTPVFLPGKSHGQKSLVSDKPMGLQESDMI